MSLSAVEAILREGADDLVPDADGQVAFCIKIDEFCIRNDEFCIEIDGFCIKSDEFNTQAQTAVAIAEALVFFHKTRGARNVKAMDTASRATWCLLLATRPRVTKLLLLRNVQECTTY